MGVVDSVKDWVFGIAVKKAIKRLVQLLVAFAVGKGVPAILANYGIAVDTAKLETELIVAAYAGIEILRNWLKVKVGVKWL